MTAVVAVLKITLQKAVVKQNVAERVQQGSGPQAQTKPTEKKIQSKNTAVNTQAGDIVVLIKETMRWVSLWVVQAAAASCACARCSKLTVIILSSKDVTRSKGK